MFVVILWGLTLIATLRGENVTRGLLSGVMGLLIGTIGMSPNGVLRGTLGSPYLIDGVPVIPAMIGMFAASELFALVGKSRSEEHTSELQSLMRISYAVFCLKKTNNTTISPTTYHTL